MEFLQQFLSQIGVAPVWANLIVAIAGVIVYYVGRSRGRKGKK